jgi:hypothetical protein
MLKKAKQVQFFEETFTAWDGCRYDGWVQLELESGEIVSIPGNYFKRKCKKCGSIEKSYGLNGLCQKCESERGEK